jgi:peptide/nickel transport system permease protein
MRGSIRASVSPEGESAMSVSAPFQFAPQVVAADEVIEIKRSAVGTVLAFCRREPVGTLGMVIVLIIAATGLGAEWIAPYSPTSNDFAAMTEAPSWTHLLGTDQLGRDIFSRIVFGARTALIVGFSSAIVGGFTGLVLGVASAYFAGYIDLIMQRVMDIMMAFPLIIMALAIVAIFGTGVHNVIVAVTIPLIPRCARVIRASALAIREMPYVDAARACGFGHMRIILRHMVPNVMAPFLIMVTAFVGQAILAEASLSYLGLGVQEPVPAWGLMLQGGAEEYATTAPWIAVFPGLAIMLTVFGFSLFGDALRDALDPKLRDR